MESLIITKQDIRKIVDTFGFTYLMKETIQGITDALRTLEERGIELKKREGFCYDSPYFGLLEWMPAMRIGDVVVVKMISYIPSNPKRNRIPSVIGTISLYNTADCSFMRYSNSNL